MITDEKISNKLENLKNTYYTSLISGVAKWHNKKEMIMYQKHLKR